MALRQVPIPASYSANNSSRVTIAGTIYNIPMFYDGAGVLFYRVRAVPNYNLGAGRSESQWSSNFVSSGVDLAHLVSEGPISLAFKLARLLPVSPKKEKEKLWFNILMGVSASVKRVTKDNSYKYSNCRRDIL